MLSIKVNESEIYDEANNEFIYVKAQTLLMEHSLISISKWEKKYHKPFLHNVDKFTPDEQLYYFKCMTITQNVDDMAYRCLGKKNIRKINEYINDPMTATTFTLPNGPNRRDIITNEVIYYRMLKFGIPFECEKWHLNHLLTLIKVCSVKEGPVQKMSSSDLASRNRALNMQRRKRFNSNG